MSETFLSTPGASWPGRPEFQRTVGRCDLCGRFTKASELHLRYGPMPDSGPDGEECTSCRRARNQLYQAESS